MSTTDTTTDKPNTIEIKCLLFAKVKEMILGEHSKDDSVIVNLPANKCTTHQLISELKLKYPNISNLLDVCMVAVNLEYIDRSNDLEIKKRDEVAIIPPVSGG
ncbi:molybdenum cofactor synthesis protein 2 small subunit [Heterostelium album PN500]|uniref:Molybdopterin synthase sulfur carrier subunit n=1 Tax=Heterostelium pallidum (strain ATCC 26659 / Pp 5 / PN500) TaxID=670386 RepID=D3AXS2_HETP5|nr:molybdenum cofactor synthesis protein 2 small subunit [Heterostelium album PN500]EFA85749.1 molybdenum cofactor synthesis protein 2 small subunit [Heterostelium album PN500]|eukprot:XP_020437855.1 molybdenum cofactor synthesis protein 2 small subunit [Heterostelium album PN500]